MTTASLGFTLRLARSHRDLLDACAVRAAAYGHHVPGMAETLAEPDATDHQPGSVVMVCRDKAEGQAIGTARIQRSQAAPLQIENSVILPHHIAGRQRAEITRLAVRSGADPLVRAMLFKACYLYAMASQVSWLVIGARSQALIRIYRGLGFADLLGEGQQVPLAHAGGLLHSVLAFDVVAAERTWHGCEHGLYPLMVETWHPDVQLMAEQELPETFNLPQRAQDQRQAA